jgi:ABC-type glycerol-3-phosphate transport system permease component
MAVVLTSAAVGYIFAKYRFRGRSVIYVAVMVTMFIPSQVTIIPLYMLFSRMRLVDTYWSVILSYLALFLPEAILRMTANFRSLIDELLEAAEIDGCGYFQKVWNVVVPMGRAAIFLAIIFYFITAWNDLFTPMIFLQSMEKRTVMVALAARLHNWERGCSHPLCAEPRVEAWKYPPDSTVDDKNVRTPVIAVRCTVTVGDRVVPTHTASTCLLSAPPTLSAPLTAPGRATPLL